MKKRLFLILSSFLYVTSAYAAEEAIQQSKIPEDKEFMNCSNPNYEKSAEALRKLDPTQFHVTQENGTERPFLNAYWNNHEEGIYVDVVSGEPLFSSTDKFDSGTGWPSFTKPLKAEHLEEKTDNKLGMTRTEVRSKHGDSHLGHVFNDGPKEKGGMRYCINSASLRFIPKKDLAAEGYEEYLKLFK